MPLTPDPVEETADNATGYVSGMMRIKVTEEMYEKIGGSNLRADNPERTAFMQKIGASKMTPTFRNLDSRFEKRHRRVGLHRWFTVEIDTSRAVTRAVQEGQSIPGVEIIEAVPEINAPKEQVFVSTSALLRSGQAALVPGEPNDTRYPEQWHLRNTAQIPGFLEGVDINALEAWNAGVTGDPKVIVAVLDGGVQVDHPDLAAHMWRNPNPDPELRDEYGEDIYGYDFDNGDTQIDPDNHGTHVAGLIGAIRNNGLGVAGVAGGDGSDDSGVRIMSCQIFGEKNSPDAVLNAFVYAADNGAVIANNSWGTGPAAGPDLITPSFKQAIDYFTDYAGCDDEGNQLEDSPMQGGLAIFAAGNQDSEIWYNPGSYSRAVGVSSVGPTASKALYTNHGVWVDIAGPGGDMNYGNPEGLVLSTITQGMYGYMQGTSQACPIVSGVAALIVSKFGKKGFTSKELRDRLLSSLRPFDIDARSPGYRGKLGAGIVDAGKAMAVNEQKAPEAVKADDLKLTPGHDRIEMKWQAVEDADDGTAVSYILYYTDSAPLSKELLNAPGVRHEILNALEYEAGEEFGFTLQGLELGRKYYFAVAAIDRWAQLSSFTFFESATLVNHLPVLKSSSKDELRLTSGDIRTIEVSVTDEDGHDWTYELTGDTKGTTHRREGDKVVIEFRKAMQAGHYSVKLTVSDPFGKSEIAIPYAISGNAAPAVTKEPGEIYSDLIHSEYRLDLGEYFSDPDGDKLTYSIVSFEPGIASAGIQEEKFAVVELHRYGTAHLEVTATDSSGQKARFSFVMHVINRDIVYTMFPVPVKDVLNVRLSDEVFTAELEVRTTLGAVKTKKFVTVRDPEDRMVKFDLSGLEPGTYVLYAKALGKEYKQNFLKN